MEQDAVVTRIHVNGLKRLIFMHLYQCQVCRKAKSHASQLILLPLSHLD